MDREPVVTIDGPAGAGKSTVARALAARLGYRLLDTGAMYRALALSVTRAGIPLEDGPALRRHLDAVTITVVAGRVLLNDRDVTDEIRSQELGQATSVLTTVPAVREKVTPLQRRAALGGGVVLEGRDTGTVVCPDAEAKFYLDATLEERARRRHAELAQRGSGGSLDAVRAEISARDAQDRERAIAPLRKASDAVVVDTTELSIEQVVETMARAVERRRCCTAS
jgi:CMP/dCMP kinase